MKTDDYLIVLCVLAVVATLGVLFLVMRQLAGDLVYDPVAHDMEQVQTLLWRLIDLVIERCGR